MLAGRSSAAAARCSAPTGWRVKSSHAAACLSCGLPRARTPLHRNLANALRLHAQPCSASTWRSAERSPLPGLPGGRLPARRRMQRRQHCGKLRVAADPLVSIGGRCNAPALVEHCCRSPLSVRTASHPRPPSHFSAWRQVPLGLDFLTFLAATVLVIPTFKSAKISPVLGFLFSGLLLGQLGCAPMAPARAAKQHTYPAGGASSVF